MALLLKTLLGVDCLSFSSVAQMIERPDLTLAAKIVFLDVNLGEGSPTGFDAYCWLSDKKFSGKIYFLTGHARHHPQMAAINSTGVTVLEKPLPSAELVRIVRQAVPDIGGQK